MARSIGYDELIRRFPMLSAALIVPMRCVSPVRGRGKYVKQLKDRPHQFGDVEVSASPAGVLSIHLAHSWPSELSNDEIVRLDDALVLGLVEGIAREEWPPMECALTCESVGYVNGDTTPVAVRIAAAMAVRSMCRRSGWEGLNGAAPPDDVA